MCKKIYLYLWLYLLSNNFYSYSVPSNLPQFSFEIAQQEQCDAYDHLDFLADNEPYVATKPPPIPQWLKSFFVGLIVRLAYVNEYWEKTWQRIKLLLIRK